jgi:uncharacterized protein YegP (UPF0339 family)
MSRQPRFEVVRTDDGWHARFRAANGRIVWTTEVYTRRSAAVQALTILDWTTAEGSNAVHIDEREPAS